MNCPNGAREGALGYDSAHPMGPPAATQRSGRRGERRPSGGNELSGLPGSERSVAWADDVGRSILDASFSSRHRHRGISEAWHRRRPGGPSRYSAAAVRACGVIPMRAARGAASSAQATDRSLPGRPESSFPPLGLLSPPNPLRWASAGAPITASTSQWDGRQCRPGLCPVYTAHRRHEPSVSGGAGGTPPAPSFPPFLREEMGAPAAQACPPGGTPANNGGGKPPPYSAWQFPRQPGFYQTGDHRSPLRTARRVVAPHG